MKPDGRHPEESTLALLAGGDVAWWEFLESRWHARFCPRCNRQIAQFRWARMELGLVSGTDLRYPVEAQPGENENSWNELEAEIRANIRLGLAAGSLAAGPSEADEASLRPFPFPRWRWAVVCGAMAFVLATGWWLRSPGGAPLPAASSPEVETPTTQASGHRIGIQLLAPVANFSRTETDFDGSTRSRVFDGETGQVILQQVYVE